MVCVNEAGGVVLLDDICILDCQGLGLGLQTFINKASFLGQCWADGKTARVKYLTKLTSPDCWWRAVSVIAPRPPVVVASGAFQVETSNGMGVGVGREEAAFRARPVDKTAIRWLSKSRYQLNEEPCMLFGMNLRQYLKVRNMQPAHPKRGNEIFAGVEADCDCWTS